MANESTAPTGSAPAGVAPTPASGPGSTTSSISQSTSNGGLVNHHHRRPHSNISQSCSDHPSSTGTKQRTFVVIREVYDSGHNGEEFADQLDAALSEGVSLVVVEPCALGEETGRWIRIGNMLHKSTVLSGLAALVAAPVCTRSSVTSSLSLASVSLAGLYHFCWYCDPCAQYQVEKNITRLKDSLPYSRLASSNPVVLIRREDRRRRWLHNGVASVSLIATLWLLYRSR